MSGSLDPEGGNLIKELPMSEFQAVSESELQSISGGLVVIAIIIVLMPLLMPAVQK